MMSATCGSRLPRAIPCTGGGVIDACHGLLNLKFVASWSWLELPFCPSLLNAVAEQELATMSRRGSGTQVRLNEPRFVMWRDEPGWGFDVVTSTLPYVNVERSSELHRLSYPSTRRRRARVDRVRPGS